MFNMKFEVPVTITILGATHTFNIPVDVDFGSLTAVKEDIKKEDTPSADKKEKENVRKPWQGNRKKVSNADTTQEKKRKPAKKTTVLTGYKPPREFHFGKEPFEYSFLRNGEIISCRKWTKKETVKYIDLVSEGYSLPEIQEELFKAFGYRRTLKSLAGKAQMIRNKGYIFAIGQRRKAN